jgi:hypothetical protein
MKNSKIEAERSSSFSQTFFDQILGPLLAEAICWALILPVFFVLKGLVGSIEQHLGFWLQIVGIGIAVCIFLAIWGVTGLWLKRRRDHRRLNWATLLPK